MLESPQEIRKKIEARYRRRMLLLIHIGIALFTLPLFNSNPFSPIDETIFFFVWLTVVMHALRLVMLRSMERAIEREIQGRHKAYSAAGLEQMIEREVSRRLAEHGLYADEKPKHGSAYAQDRAMRLTSDGELVELPDTDEAYAAQGRKTSS